jgi:thermitase
VVTLPEVQSASEAQSLKVAAANKGLSHAKSGRYAVLSRDAAVKSRPGISSPSEEARAWELCASLIQDGLAKPGHCEPQYRYRVSATPNDPRFNETYGFIKVQAREAWDRTTGSRNIKVAVIDTGVDYNHPDLSANVAPSLGHDFVNNDTDAMDDHGHGTHCAGTVGAVGNDGIGVAGANWLVTIIPIKVLGADGSGTNAQIAAGVDHAVAKGAHVISMSLGGPGASSTLEAAIRRASNAGVLTIVAAGNESTNNDVTPSYPAAFSIPHMLSVAATDINDQLASFSNFGTGTTQISAPGVGILSTVPGGGYDSWDGTSMATPLVAGVAALTLSAQPGLNATQLRDILLNTSDSIVGLTSAVQKGRRVNANNAVAQALGTTPLPPGPPADQPAPGNPGDPGSGTPLDEYSLYVETKSVSVRSSKVSVEAYALAPDEESVFTGVTMYASCYNARGRVLYDREAVTDEEDGVATFGGKLKGLPRQMAAAKRYMRGVSCWLETYDEESDSDEPKESLEFKLKLVR